MAPFTEFSYIHQFSNEKLDFSEEREKRFKCAEQAFLSTMRSWSGLTQMCQPRPVGPSNLQAVIDVLYLKNNEVRVSLDLVTFDLVNNLGTTEFLFIEQFEGDGNVH